jgi:hypothetical protein
MKSDLPRVGTDEFWQVLEDSVGWNLAVDYIADARDLSADQLLGLDRNTLQHMAWLDVLFANYDRSRTSINVLRDNAERHWLIDHGSARILARLRAPPRSFTLPPNHLLGEWDWRALLTELSPLPAPLSMSEICADLPDAWLREADFTPEQLAQGLSERLHAFRAWITTLSI